MSNPFPFSQLGVHENHLEQLKGFRFDRIIKIMEVCGTHTVALHRFGIQQLLPENVKLVSGPGCPVCVTPDSYIDEAVELARMGYVIATFGDMIKVPGSESSLQMERANGRDIRIVYSPLDAMLMAENSEKHVVFLSVGFETTVPGIAVAVQQAQAKNLDNFSMLTGNRIIPPAMTALIKGGSEINGFLLPGHVSAIIGKVGYEFLNEFNVPGVIAGFEAVDIVSSLIVLLKMIEENDPGIRNNYRRIVKDEGNAKSLSILNNVFRRVDAEWRGLGVIPRSGLKLRDAYKKYDTRERVILNIKPPKPNPHCRCGEVLAGKITPPDCKLFKNGCDPDHPKGPCMVSSEGTCGAYYNYS